MKIIIIILVMLFNACGNGGEDDNTSICSTCNGALDLNFNEGLCDQTALNELGCNNIFEVTNQGEVLYNLSEDLAGFQFGVKASGGIVINGVSGGTAFNNNFSVSFNCDNPTVDYDCKIIGFIFGTNFINAGCDKLLDISFDGTHESIQIVSAVFSGEVINGPAPNLNVNYCSE